MKKKHIQFLAKKVEPRQHALILRNSYMLMKQERNSIFVSFNYITNYFNYDIKNIVKTRDEISEE